MFRKLAHQRQLSRRLSGRCSGARPRCAFVVMLGDAAVMLFTPTSDQCLAMGGAVCYDPRYFHMELCDGMDYDE